MITQELRCEIQCCNPGQLVVAAAAFLFCCKTEKNKTKQDIQQKTKANKNTIKQQNWGDFPAEVAFKVVVKS